MAKKKINKITKKEPTKEAEATRTDLTANLPADMPQDARDKLEQIKKYLDQFQEKTLKKFEDYVLGIALLPPTKVEEVEQAEERTLTNKEKEEIQQRINVLVLIDDTDSKKMSKEELKEKLTGIINGFAKEVSKRLNPEVILLTEVWQSCYDAKYDLIQQIAMAAPVYDKGMLAAIKIAEIHKTMVLKKFEKYIVAYVLAGSLVQGRATPQSDIDVFVVIDDTDVKKMTRAELKDKLRAIIISMGIEAGKMTGIENKLNVQVYILTDFWESIKEANPVIFTFLRDGIPFFDRGIFMPWKQLLKMGRIKPSQEAIDLFMGTGEQMLDRTRNKIREIAIEDFFWATITPSQAAIMLYGLPPPTPKETPEVLREMFVKKEKILEEEYVKIIEKILKTRKDIEHGEKRNVTGAELDELLTSSEKYLKRLKKLFDQIEKIKEKQTIIETYDNVITIARDAIKTTGKKEKIAEEEITKLFKEEIIKTGRMPEKNLRLLENFIKAKKHYEKGKITSVEVQTATKEAREFIRNTIEYLQREQIKGIERAKINIIYGKKQAQLLLLEKEAYLIEDLESENRKVLKAEKNNNNELTNWQESTLEEMDEAARKATNIEPATITKELTKSLEEKLGKEIKIRIA